LLHKNSCKDLTAIYTSLNLDGAQTVPSLFLLSVFTAIYCHFLTWTIQWCKCNTTVFDYGFGSFLKFYFFSFTCSVFVVSKNKTLKVRIFYSAVMFYLWDCLKKPLECILFWICFFSSTLLHLNCNWVKMSYSNTNLTQNRTGRLLYL